MRRRPGSNSVVRPGLASTPNQPRREVTLPTVLEGVRVLDFGRYIAGPYAASVLADFGSLMN